MPLSSGNPALLETFPNPHPQRDYEIQHVAPEFTSVCPMTGQPDFGTIRLTYIPDKLCVELKSYKFYLQSFRQCGIFYEDVTNRLLDDLVKALKPRSMTLTTEWTPRGGLHSIVTANYEAPYNPPKEVKRTKAPHTVRPIMPDIRIGISGWRYEPWRGTFYPEDLTQKKELHYASRQLNSIEINGSFYSLQRPSSWKQWYEETPADFVFSVKCSRYITHMRRLKDIDEPLTNFYAQGLLALKEKLGPFLWQFPPNFKFDPDRFEAFFEKLPRDTKEAAKLAKNHTAFMKGRTYFEVDKNRPLRHAIEIRHDSFKTPDFIALLRKHNIALVVADTAGKWPFMEDLTSDFVYARLHGDEQLYSSGYTPDALDKWAARVNAWLKGTEAKDAEYASDKPPKKRKTRDVHIYFDNDLKVRAPFDAMGLSQRVGGYLPDPIPVMPPKKLKEEARAHWPLVRP